VDDQLRDRDGSIRHLQKKVNIVLY